MPHLTRRSVGLGVSSIGEQVLMTKLLSGIAGIVIGLATATTASANCNASFDGIWKWQGQGQGQYTEVELIHFSPFSDISVQTETGTCRGRLMISCLIYDARYDAQRYGNVSAQMINGT